MLPQPHIRNVSTSAAGRVRIDRVSDQWRAEYVLYLDGVYYSSYDSRDDAEAAGAAWLAEQPPAAVETESIIRVTINRKQDRAIISRGTEADTHRAHTYRNITPSSRARLLRVLAGLLSEYADGSLRGEFHADMVRRQEIAPASSAYAVAQRDTYVAVIGPNGNEIVQFPQDVNGQRDAAELVETLNGDLAAGESAPTFPAPAPAYEKEIVYDRETGDFAMLLDGECVGFARSYLDAERTLDALVYELLNGGRYRPAA